MPSSEKHLNQYLSNKDTLEKLSNLENPPYDWMVTIAFYSALHLIENILASQNKHFSGHTERNLHVQNEDFFSGIASEYRALYRDSRKSRYDCGNITVGKANSSLNYLKVIEKFCLSVK